MRKSTRWWMGEVEGRGGWEDAGSIEHWTLNIEHWTLNIGTMRYIPFVWTFLGFPFFFLCVFHAPLWGLRNGGGRIREDERVDWRVLKKKARRERRIETREEVGRWWCVRVSGGGGFVESLRVLVEQDSLNESVWVEESSCSRSRRKNRLNGWGKVCQSGQGMDGQ